MESGVGVGSGVAEGKGEAVGKAVETCVWGAGVTFSSSSSLPQLMTSAINKKNIATNMNLCTFSLSFRLVLNPNRFSSGCLLKASRQFIRRQSNGDEL